MLQQKFLPFINLLFLSRCAASGAASGAGDAKTCARAWSDAGATYVHVPGSRPAPSCTILLRDLRDLISFDASSRSLPGQAPGGKLELDSKLQWPRCLAMNFLHLPTSSYLDVHFSLSVVYKSLSKRPNFSFFFGWARAHKGLHFIPKNRARTQPKQYVFLHGNPLSKIAKYMLYYSFSLGIFHV